MSDTIAGDRDTLSRLLAAASASLDSDRDLAKACIQRAAELLRSPHSKHAPGASTARGGLAAWQKQRLAAYVAANLGSRIRAADLAHLTGLSIGHFFRAFRESFGEPPLLYITRQRVQHCQQLISSSHAPLSEIALDCGMCDQAHLTRVFRRIVGVNPGVWRRQFAQRVTNPHIRE
jgi:transcriptional regulator GlxA family with amidase domain